MVSVMKKPVYKILSKLSKKGVAGVRKHRAVLSYLVVAAVVTESLCGASGIISNAAETTSQVAASAQNVTEITQVKSSIVKSASSGKSAGDLLSGGGISAFLREDTSIAKVADLTLDEAVEYYVTEAAEDENREEYSNFAIANVRDYVNVRSGPGTTYEVVGKMYNGSVAEIQETVECDDGNWLKVISGNVEGYIKEQYFYVGDEAVEKIEDYLKHYAEVQASVLNVRKEADIDSDRIGYVQSGEKLNVLNDEESTDEWIHVQYTADKTGFVSAEYVVLSEEYVCAKSMEEIRAEQEAEKAKRARQAISVADTAVSMTPPTFTTYENASDLRKAIVDYAKQFVGMRYVSGGQSLANGTDCSGFTCYVYKEFGYSLSRTPGGQYSSNGRFVSLEEAQPGDIVCYGSGGCTHVGMYIGDGQIVQEANSRLGCVISTVYFMNIVGIKNVID